MPPLDTPARRRHAGARLGPGHPQLHQPRARRVRDADSHRAVFIALDLEYDSARVWLTGVLIVDEGHHEHIALWADDAEDAVCSPGEVRGRSPQRAQSTTSRSQL